jgi:ABC-type dipeptide/oligopeptide/nickel transport system permease component
MLSFILRRILYSIPVLLVASFLTFWGIRSTFDPLARFHNSRDAGRLVAQQRKALHLDRPIVWQWWHWLSGFVRGDMGTSWRTHENVSEMIRRASWPTLQLLFWGTLVSLTIAIGIGIYSAVKQYSVGDYAFTGLSYLGIAMPPFWFGLLAIGLLVTYPKTHWNLNGPILYSVGLHSEGQSGLNLDYFRHLALPVAVLAVQSVAAWSRFVRASMLDVLHADYVRTARAKGVPQRKVIFKHAFRNACIPLITVVALDTAFLIGGLLITEQIFAIPGMGRLFLDSLLTGDAPVLLSWFVVVAATVIVFNLIADVMYGVADPRIRVS